MSNTCFDYSPLFSGIAVFGLYQFVLGEGSIRRSAYLAGATIGGIYAGQVLAPMVPFYSSLPSTTLYNNKTLELRLLELGLGAGGAYALTKFTPIRYTSNEFASKVGIIVAGSVAGSYLNEYMCSKPLSYLN